MPPTHSKPQEQLTREIGVGGAVVLGLGSILGTGVFVSISVAAGVAGPLVIPAIAIAAVVATCNGLSSAQLAANHPVSGGTYEYGYRWLHPLIGFLAGWLFLCAKSASAATAALGVSGYLLKLLGVTDSQWMIGVALLAAALVTLLVLGGLRRSNTVNTILVAVTLLSLTTFVLAGWKSAADGMSNLRPDGTIGASELRGLLQACALMFVAYTGYGRIATMGEEIKEPQRNIPRAMISTLVVSMTVYLAVAIVAVMAVGADSFAKAGATMAAPLEAVTRQFAPPHVAILISLGGLTAMIGVLLNLVLGLSRVVLAMARRADMPTLFASLDASGTTPRAAVVLVGLIIAGLVAIGDVKITWSFSAFTVLLYYGLTNLAALRLCDNERLYPRWISLLGMASCVFLAFWVAPKVWVIGLGVIAVGCGWFGIASRIKRS